MTTQLRLGLSARPERGSFACGDIVARLASSAINNSGKSRELIAAEMSDLIGCPITVAQLNAWTAESKAGHRLPVEYLGAFTLVTGCSALLELAAEQAGVVVVDEVERRLLQFHRAQRELRDRRRKVVALKLWLQENGEDV